LFPTSREKERSPASYKEKEGGKKRKGSQSVTKEEKKRKVIIEGERDGREILSLFQQKGRYPREEEGKRKSLSWPRGGVNSQAFKRRAEGSSPSKILLRLGGEKGEKSPFESRAFWGGKKGGRFWERKKRKGPLFLSEGRGNGLLFSGKGEKEKRDKKGKKRCFLINGKGKRGKGRAYANSKMRRGGGG